MIAVILVALVVGIGLGFWGSREWLCKSLWDIEAKLRKELGEVRAELAMHEVKDWKKGLGAFWIGGFDPAVRDESRIPDSKGSVAHFDLTEPKIERREHSDVFKIASIDALIEGTR